MPQSFDDVVAARTRAASQILGSEALLRAYEQVGGMRDDLVMIRDQGLRAEALNLGQGQSKTASEAATLSLLTELAEVQREYAQVMAVVRAVRGELDEAEGGRDAELIKALDRIIKNEAQVSVRTAPVAEGEARRKRAPSRGQEPVRAEIERDAVALLELPAAHPLLGARKVDAARLERLRDRARGLAGKLATRAERKGSAKAVTKTEREAVKRQTRKWSDCYALLAQAANLEAGIAGLLRDAAEKKRR